MIATIGFFITTACHSQFVSGEFDTLYRPADSSRSNPQGASSSTYNYSEPILTGNSVSYQVLATAAAIPVWPWVPIGQFPNPVTEVAIPNGAGFTEYNIKVNGPGFVGVWGSASASGSAAGLNVYEQYVTSADVTAGGFVKWRALQLTNWFASADQLRPGQSRSSSKSANVLFKAETGIGTLLLNDSTGVRVVAISDNKNAGQSTGTGVASWTATFFPESPKPKGDLRCQGTDGPCNLNTNGNCIYIAIHGYNSSSGTTWIQQLKGALSLRSGSVCAWDWSADAAPAGQPENPAEQRRVINKAKDQGRKLAAALIACSIDPRKVHIIAHSYGSEVANVLGQELKARGYGVIKDVTLIDMPYVSIEHPLGLPIGIVPIRDFDPRNFDHVSNLYGTGYSALGAPLCGSNFSNVANVVVRGDNLPVPIGDTQNLVHTRMALYVGDLVSARSAAVGDACGDTPPLLGNYSNDPSQPAKLEMNPGACDPPQVVNLLNSSSDGPPFYALPWKTFNGAIDSKLNQASLMTHSPAALTTHIKWPVNVDYIRFKYAVPQGSDTDSFCLHFNDERLFFSDTWRTPSDTFLDSLLIDVQHLQGIEGELSFLLSSPGQPGTQFLIRDLQFLTAIPVLNIERKGSGLVISWAASVSGFVLQAASNLQPPDGWSTITSDVIINNSAKIVTVNLGDSQSFFRLVKL
ncbi:hypothetical protein HYR54_09225 [Candidatus Acetothermia bacterium]|nr:hypothetical protein [Candidatus Acetothermia bacterium]MBI3869559.1 hypothetical protein [Verrucomicrobiota bacterium]